MTDTLPLPAGLPINMDDAGTNYNCTVPIPTKFIIRHDDEYISHAIRSGKERAIRAILDNISNGEHYTLRIDEIWPDELKYVEGGWDAGPDIILVRIVVRLGVVSKIPVYVHEEEVTYTAPKVVRNIFKWLMNRFRQVQREIRDYRD